MSKQLWYCECCEDDVEWPFKIEKPFLTTSFVITYYLCEDCMEIIYPEWVEYFDKAEGLD